MKYNSFVKQEKKRASIGDPINYINIWQKEYYFLRFHLHFYIRFITELRFSNFSQDNFLNLQSTHNLACSKGFDR